MQQGHLMLVIVSKLVLQRITYKLDSNYLHIFLSLCRKKNKLVFVNVDFVYTKPCLILKDIFHENLVYKNVLPAKKRNLRYFNIAHTPTKNECIKCLLV